MSAVMEPTSAVAKTLSASLEVEAARGRLCDWERGFMQGYAGASREVGSSASYLSGYRAGQRNALPVDPVPLSRHRRKVAA